MSNWLYSVGVLLAVAGEANADEGGAGLVGSWDVEVGGWKRLGAHAKLRIDAGGTIGKPISLSSFQHDPQQWRRAVELELRAGVVFAGDVEGLDGVAFRPHLVVAGRLRPPRFIRAVEAISIDLSIAGLIGSFRGAEAGVDVRVLPWGGLFARVGYLWAPEQGAVVAGGLRVDGKPAAVLIATSALIGLTAILLSGFYFVPDG